MVFRASTVLLLLLVTKNSVQQDQKTSNAAFDSMESVATESVDTTPANIYVEEDSQTYTNIETTSEFEDSQTYTNIEAKNELEDAETGELTESEDAVVPIPHVHAPPPTPTPRKTIFGSQCEIPFMYNGEEQFNCFWGHDAMEYCKVGGIIYECEPMIYPDQPGKTRDPKTSPADLEIVERYTTGGTKCSFPKEYNGRLLTDCYRVSANQEICYAAGKWHTCAPLDSNGSPVYPQQPESPAFDADGVPTENNNQVSQITIQRYTTTGKLCAVPFMYNGEEQYDCVTMPDKKEWCFMNGDWLQCADVMQSANPAFRNAQNYEAYEDDQEYTEDGSKQEHSSGNMGITIAVVIGLVTLAAASLGGYLYLRKPRTQQYSTK